MIDNVSRETSPLSEEELLYNVAQRLLLGKDLKSAHTVATNLTYRDPSQGRYHQMLGLVLQEMKDYVRALYAYEQAFLVDCYDPKTAHCACQCCIFLERWDRAHHWLQAWQFLEPDSPLLPKMALVINKNLQQ